MNGTVHTFDKNQLCALQFLGQAGPHCIGYIDNKVKQTAFVTLTELVQKGLATITASVNGPVYSLSAEGRCALALLFGCEQTQH